MRRSLPIFLTIVMIILKSHLSFSSDYPPPGCLVYEDMSLLICPPDTMPGPPVQLLKYLIYADSVFIDDIDVLAPADTVIYFFEDSQLDPGLTEFCVKAVYSVWISDPVCIIDTVFYGFPLPFYEDWTSGSFETNGWTVDGSNWGISSTEGSPSPALVFSGAPSLENYSEIIASYYITRNSLPPRLLTYIEYDLWWQNVNQTGEEQLSLEFWHWESGTWETVGVVKNLWPSAYRRMRYLLDGEGEMFRLRFRASGVNSADIVGWIIDNLQVTQECAQPTHVVIQEQWWYNTNRVEWYPPNGLNLPEWYRIGDDFNHSAIGTGDPVEFQVAVKWDGLSQYPQDAGITRVKFFPAESNAQYTVRIWQGTYPELVYEEYVPDAEINAWNTVELDSVLVFSSTDTVWVGYHILAEEGYPAGCDDGPAVDGYGNFIDYGGWATLLQINPELDYNWSIQAEVTTPWPVTDGFSHYNVYRSFDLYEGYEYLDSTSDVWYNDTLYPPWQDIYCYKISAVWVNGSDTCMSHLSEQGCTIILLGENQPYAVNDSFAIRMSPNPAREVVHVSSEIMLSWIEIYNLLGSMVYRGEINHYTADINISHLAQGLHIIRVMTQEGVVSRKLVISR